MSTQPPPRNLRRHNAARRHLRHLWIVIVLLLAVAILALCGRSASAQTDRVQETVDRALALKADARHGKALYKEHCASCHGNQAQGDAGNATPALAGQIVPYVIKQLADIAESHRQLPEMQRFIARPELSTPRAARDIATYVGRVA